jgi:hypothetical protein
MGAQFEGRRAGCMRRRADTQLIFIDPEDGRLKYSNSPGIDNFDCEARRSQAC